MTRVPAVFVSSTFYDLRQIRADLADFFASDLGYRFLASEYNSFPVEPTADAIENCRRRVETDADVMILIIGARYGSVPAGLATSVTNLEYLTARAKGIPLYAFVHRDILTLLPTWEANQSADFSRAVDSTRLFEFVKLVRDEHKVWSFPFETAQEIVAALRVQFAYLMARGLQVMSALRAHPQDLQGLTGEAFRLALERPVGWQGRLLAALVAAEVDAAADERREHDAGITFGGGEHVTDEEIGAWQRTVSSQARRLIEAIKLTAHQALNQALATGDVRVIAFGARQIGRAYRDCLQWAVRLRRAHVPDDVVPVVREQSLWFDDTIQKIATFAERLNAQIDAVTSESWEGARVVEFEFNLKLSNMERFEKEMEKLLRNRGIE
jgi:uncharacterized protein DUF4062